MANIAAAYGPNNQTVTITLASLAAGAARQSTVIAVSGLSPIPLDILMTFKLKSGATNTGFYCTVYAFGTTDGGTTYTDNAGASDAAITLPTSPNSRVVGIINMPAASTSYVAGPFSFAAAFGGSMPASLGSIVQNNTGGTLDSTAGNFLVTYQAVYETVV